MTQGDLILYRKNKQPFILHPYNSVPAISSSTSLAPTISLSSTGLTTNSTSHSSAETAISTEATAAGTLSLPIPPPPPDFSPPSSSKFDLLPVSIPALSEEVLRDNVNSVEGETNRDLDEDKKIDEEKEKENEVKEIIDGENQLNKSADYEASSVVASIATIDNTRDDVDSHPNASTVYSSITDKIIPSDSVSIAETLPIKDTLNSNNVGNGKMATDIGQIDHMNKNSSPAEILDVDPRSHTMILEHVNPLCTTESIQTDSFDNFDEEDIDSYFDCLTDSKSWDESDICALLNDSEIHEVVEELVLKVIKKASNEDQEKLNSHMDIVSDSKDTIKDFKILEINNESCAPVSNESNTVKIESKDGYEHDNNNDNNDDKGVTISDSTHCDIHLDSDELALLRYQNDCSAGLDDVAHKDYYAWQTSRRWTAATVKVLLNGLIEYVSLSSLILSFIINSFVLLYPALPCLSHIFSTIRLGVQLNMHMLHFMT